MKVVGFTFIRNAIKYDYPIEEAIRSILPICDKVIVSVGNSEDDTRKLVENIAPNRIEIIDTVWDEALREGGKVLAVETDKAKAALPDDTDWAIYIQGDEVLHEDGLEAIRNQMLASKDDGRVEGLLFDYQHFYGSYDYVGDSTQWYNKEVRIIKNDPDIYSFRDAIGFQKKGRPLRVKKSGGTIHHYGWVKDPRIMQKKQESFNKLWHSDNWMEENIANADAFDYSKIDLLHKFQGTHPSVMQNRIARLNWGFNHDISTNKTTLKDRFKNLAASLGLEIGYKNYRLLR